MNSHLLATKFHIPSRRASLVERTRLLEKLDRGLYEGSKLTLISAPAGYGKTTLIAEWIAHLQATTAQQKPRLSWLSLDPADNQPGRFFTCFIAALRQVENSFCTDLFATLQAGQVPPLDAQVTVMVNEMLAWEMPHFLVLDDFQHIQDVAIFTALTALLNHQPPNFHLVLVTREDPPLPLARLRASRQLSEIRAADLRFSETEALQMLRDCLQLQLSAADIARLTERTEGWAAGLQLAGISLQGHQNPGEFVQTLSGSHRFILDYLTDEALTHQPPVVQAFLLETSILSRLSGDLCAAVTGRADSAALLEGLLAANLFIIPLDDEGRWYRYHHLFAELLQHKLRREQAARLPELHQRASLWYENQGESAAAIEHALAAADFARAAALLEQDYWRLITRGHSRMLIKWMRSLPEPFHARNPKLHSGIAWSHILHSDYPAAMAALVEAQRGLEDLPPDSSAYRALQADLLAVQSIIAQAEGKVPQALKLAETAKSLAPAGDLRLTASVSLAFGISCRLAGHFEEAIETLQGAIRAAQAIEDHVTAMIAMAHLSLVWYPLGRLRLLAEQAESVIERAERISGVAPFMIGSVHAVLGAIYYEWNQIERARASLLHSIRLASLSEQPTSLIYAYVHLARLYQGEGDLQAAARSLDEAGEMVSKSGPGWVRPDWLAQKVSLLLAQGNCSEAESTLMAAGIPVEAPITYRTDAVHLAWLRWMIASRHPGAFSLAERIVHSAEAEGRNGTLIYALVLGAKAGGGREWLARARQLGEPEGYQRVFLDESGDEKVITSSDLIEQLTEREREVLFLLAEGLTYAQIAERLVVSVNTVRYHIKGVYAKLGVEKQVQAVERGRALGLI